ncbi:MAG: hypothetical protein AB1806_08205 [Acidobacteriota bacterium]
MAAADSDSDIRDLVQRAACLPYGLSLVEFGLPACAGEILGVPAETIARARAALADSSSRAALVAEYESAVRHRAQDPEASCRWCIQERRMPASGCPLALLQEAETRPSGLDELRSASLEAAAVSFRVHPFVILGARELLARRGRGTDAR